MSKPQASSLKPDLRLTAGLLTTALLLLSPNTQAVGIVNGDFGSGDFTGWSLDTDGVPGGPNDFMVIGTPGAYSARIEDDYWDVPGDIFSIPLNDVFFANTLYQEIDTSIGAGFDLQLSFDWDFGGEDGDPTVGEIFLVGLNDGGGTYYGADGALGFLIDPTTSYGNGSFSTLLDAASFANVAGWYLDIQLGVGADALGDPNGLGSYVELDNVSLTAVPSAVAPAPTTWLLLAAGILGVAGARRRMAIDL